MKFNRQHETIEIEEMIDELNFMLKKVNLFTMDDFQLHELYINLSRAWLIFQHYKNRNIYKPI